MIPITRLPDETLIYEYACHEGNYAMTNLLAGGRVDAAKRHGTKMTHAQHHVHAAARSSSRVWSPGARPRPPRTMRSRRSSTPTKPFKMRGTVVKMEWINPHTWLHLDVKRPDGKTERWMIEGGPPNALYRRGFTKDSLPVGSELVVEGFRAKDGSIKGNGRELTFSDGRRLFVGSSGTGAPGEK